ncbi:MAG: carboxypeptidase-like regulatory domain-containing protein, partial [Bacteroidales bacterium]|nr:carboxypeptidase-like regulatory domain-containing protein [Bacteroidales bacterium]
MCVIAVFAMLIGPNAAFAQVTTSAMNGRVLDSSNDPLPGATVMAVHEPSGTRYGTTTNIEGRFNLQGMRTGGPYRVEVSYIGYSTESFSDINLLLGETFNLEIILTEGAVELGEVVIVGMRASAFQTDRTGATTNISNQQLNAMPSINRSVQDVVRFSPFANGMGFAGGDGRSTNFTVDGANFNNNFGLSANLPGGG